MLRRTPKISALIAAQRHTKASRSTRPRMTLQQGLFCGPITIAFNRLAQTFRFKSLQLLGGGAGIDGGVEGGVVGGGVEGGGVEGAITSGDGEGGVEGSTTGGVEGGVEGGGVEGAITGGGVERHVTGGGGGLFGVEWATTRVETKRRLRKRMKMDSTPFETILKIIACG